MQESFHPTVDGFHLTLNHTHEIASITAMNPLFFFSSSSLLLHWFFFHREMYGPRPCHRIIESREKEIYDQLWENVREEREVDREGPVAGGPHAVGSGMCLVGRLPRPESQTRCSLYHANGSRAKYSHSI